MSAINEQVDSNQTFQGRLTHQAPARKPLKVENPYTAAPTSDFEISLDRWYGIDANIQQSIGLARWISSEAVCAEAAVNMRTRCTRSSRGFSGRISSGDAALKLMLVRCCCVIV